MTARRVVEIFVCSAVLAVLLLSCGPNRQPAGQTAPPPSSRKNGSSVADAGGGIVVLSRETASSLLCQILRDRDDDCDRRLTIDDERPRTCSTSDEVREPTARWPYVARSERVGVELASLHEAAQLVQELVLAVRAPGPGDVRIDISRVRLDPASYLAYRIEQHYWDALTRRIDAEPQGLLRSATDEKLGAEEQRHDELCPEEARCSSCRRTQPGASAGISKTERELYVYYPASDPRARDVFAGAGIPGRLVLSPLPERPRPSWILDTTRSHRHGLLTLALDANGRGRPFVVPGGRFNEMYGWDSFFIAAGLVENPMRLELARSTADNQAYEIVHYGKILNANRTYYLTRSQPPFLTSTISELWRRLPHTTDNRRWLEGVLTAAIREYRTVWSAPPRRLGLCDGEVCLARYFGEGLGEPPEVEHGHFAWLYQAHAVSHGHCRAPGTDAESRSRFLDCTEQLAERYRAGKLADRELDDFFTNDRCVRESGHDTTFRWFDGGRERCADFATVDLNSLLFKYEADIATLLASAFDGKLGGESADAFCARARARSRLIEKFLWDAEAGLFFDYDTRQRRRSKYLAATTLYPLWASQPNVCGATLATPNVADSLRRTALPPLEAAGGLLAAARASADGVRRPSVLRRTPTGAFETAVPGRQWEAPNGWAPHQMLAWEGFATAGFERDAKRLAYRWLYTIVKNAASYHGTVPEKFDVVARSHAVFQEYGNVNTEFAYIAAEGFGWMNASFVVGWRLLDPDLRNALQTLVPPERLFDG